MQIGFWSLFHGQGATTSNTLAVALQMALDYRLKMLVTHNHFEKSTMEKALLSKAYLDNPLVDLSDTGIDGLSRFARFNRLSSESIGSYSTTILQGRLDFLMGTNSSNKQLYYQDIDDAIEGILDAANRYYDLTLMDISSGNSDFSMRFLNEVDMIVVNLNQNLFVLEEFFSNPSLMDKKRFLLFGGYDNSSKYHLKAIMRRFKLTDAETAVIPYNREFADAANDGRLLPFFIKNQKAPKGDPNEYFIREVKSAAHKLLRRLDIDVGFKRIQAGGEGQ